MKKQLFIERNNRKENVSEVLKGVIFLGLDVSSPQPSTNYQSINGLDGQLDGYTTYGTKTATASFMLKSKNKLDYQLLIRDIYKKFLSREAYYISSSDMPAIRYMVHPKPFEYTRFNPKMATFSVEFEVFKGYGESNGTTLTFDQDALQVGMNMPVGHDVNYVFNEETVFRIYNASDIDIEPLRRHQLTIALVGVGKPVIENTTTGDVFKYNKAMKKGDVLNITGVYPYLNGMHCGRDTNHGIINLAAGWNTFEVTGLKSFRISFDFPYLYVHK